MDNINNLKNDTKKCSFCGEDIKAEARRCPYCGSLLDIKADEMKHGAVGIQETYKQYEEISDSQEEKPNTTAENVNSFEPDSNDEFRQDTVGENEFQGYAQSVRNSEEQSVIAGRKVQIPDNKPLSNGMKVFLTSLCTVIPGLGQLIGIIISIIFMNSEDDADRKSFGVALMIASLLVFVFSCLYCIVLVMALGAAKS